MVANGIPDDGAIEQMARAIHQQYLDDQAGKQDSAHPAMRPWSELTPELRAQNIDQARHNADKLATLGYAVVPVVEGRGGAVDLTAADVDRLARDEHDRWAREKRANGYRHGSVRCDEPPDLRHPDLLSWVELDERVREKDRSPVRAMVARYAEIGFMVVRSEEANADGGLQTD